MNWLRRLWPRRILVFCDYLADPVFSDFEWSEPADAEAFEREGERLWRVVQDELGPRWKVGYLSDAQDRVLW
jgi:hypothetical protein